MADAGKIIAVVDGTYEGLLTTIHDYYYENLRPVMVLDGSLPSFQQELGAEYAFVTRDLDKAQKVQNAIETKLTHETQGVLLLAWQSASIDKTFNIFRYILLAFKDPKGVDSRTQLDFVMNVHHLKRNVGMEAHKLNGFARFRELEDGVLYADISPKNNVLHLVAEHFTDRLMGERFVIHDVSRNLAAMYDTQECVIVEMPAEVKASLVDKHDEKEWQQLWKMFYKTLSIQERANSKLRRQLMPKYFWKHMTEHLS